MNHPLLSHLILRHLLLVVLVVFLGSCAHRRNLWREMRAPLAGPPQIYGTVSAGCIKGATSAINENVPLEFMRPSRNRVYGHPALVKYLHELAAKYYGATKDYLLIGDLSQPRGGPTGIPGGIATHSSHQTGIDVDVWYRTSPVPLLPEERERLAPTDLVKADNESMSKHWDVRKYELMLRTAALPENVERIFVHPAIKRELCIHSRKPVPAQNAWLAKIRPWWGHADHFHLRLKCPAGEKDCLSSSDPIPAGDGCDDTLNWWFSEEAKIMMADKSAKPGVYAMPKMPKQCEDIADSFKPGAN